MTHSCPYSVPPIPDCTRDYPGAPPTEVLALEAAGGVGEMIVGREQYLFVSRWDYVRDLLLDSNMVCDIHEAPSLPSGESIPAWFFGMDGASHRSLRAPLMSAFSARSLQRYESKLAEVFERRFLDAFGSSGEVDAVEHVFWPLAKDCFHSVMHTDSSLILQFEERLADFESMTDDAPPDKHSFGELWECTKAIVGSGDSGVLAELRADFSLDVAASMFISVRFAAVAPLVHFWGWAVRRMFVDDSLRSRYLVADQSSWIIDELLRQSPSNSVGVARRVAAPVTLFGRDLKPGQIVMGSLVGANWDSSRFPEPVAVHSSRPTSMAFGWGPHRCVGQSLAKIETRFLFEQLFETSAEYCLSTDRVEVIDDFMTYGLKELLLTRQS